MKKSDELKSEIEAINREVKQLDRQEASHEKQISEIKLRRRQLRGNPFSRHDRGLYGEKKYAYDKALLEEKDANSRPVVWGEGGRHKQEEKYVIDKVTPKRIYVRRAGHEYTAVFNRDGSSISKWDKTKIDIGATFQ